MWIYRILNCIKYEIWLFFSLHFVLCSDGLCAILLLCLFDSFGKWRVNIVLSELALDRCHFACFIFLLPFSRVARCVCMCTICILLSNSMKKPVIGKFCWKETFSFFNSQAVCTIILINIYTSSYIFNESNIWSSLESLVMFAEINDDRTFFSFRCFLLIAYIYETRFLFSGLSYNFFRLLPWNISTKSIHSLI